MGRVKNDAHVSGLGGQVGSGTYSEIKHIEERAGLKGWWWSLGRWIRDTGEMSKQTMLVDWVIQTNEAQDKDVNLEIINI